YFFFQAEDGIRDDLVTGVQTCALPIYRPVHERALAGAGDVGDDDKHPERDVDVDVAQVVRRRAADLQPAGGRPHRLLEGGPVVEMAPGDGAAGPQPLDGPLVADGAARCTGAGAEVDDVVG